MICVVEHFSENKLSNEEEILHHFLELQNSLADA